MEIRYQPSSAFWAGDLWGCTKCGVVVFDREKHAKSHEGYDWQFLDENVREHATLSLQRHEDGRECSYHHRLDTFVFGDNKECLRPEHKRHNGEVFIRYVNDKDLRFND